MIQRAIILCDRDIIYVDEAWLGSTSDSRYETTSSPASGEKERIEAALKESRGRISGARGAATRLGIPRTFVQDMKSTFSERGPWAPWTRVASISPVAEGPIMKHP
jgi:hypothetical protein